jgi:hypothetical protein
LFAAFLKTQEIRRLAQLVVGQILERPMVGNSLLVLVACACLIACSQKAAEEEGFGEDLHCPVPAVAQFEPWGESGQQQICKIKHGAFVAWEAGYIHVRGQYDMGKKSGLWRWYDKQGKVVREINYSPARSDVMPISGTR